MVAPNSTQLALTQTAVENHCILSSASKIFYLLLYSPEGEKEGSRLLDYSSIKDPRESLFTYTTVFQDNTHTGNSRSVENGKELFSHTRTSTAASPSGHSQTDDVCLN